MSPTPQSPIDPAGSQQLVNALLDGELSPADAAALETWLASDPEHRRVFVRQTFLHRQLRDLSAVAKLDAVDEAAPTPARARRGWSIGRWRAAAALLIGGAIVALAVAALSRATTPAAPDPGERRDIRPLAGVLMQADGVRWASSEAGAQVPEVGAPLPIGPVVIDAGTLEIEFFSGVRATVQGPAHVELMGSNRMAVHHGRAAAVVPPTAVGFSCWTPRMHIVDLGTEFAVTVGLETEDTLHVVDGEVEVDTPQRSMRVTGGRSIAVDSGGSVRATAPSDAFARPEPIVPEAYRRWVAYRNRLRGDPSLVVYYTFQGQTPDDAEAHDLSGRDHTGEIVGATVDAGRVEGKPALRFDGKDDRIRFRVPGAFESVTFSMWANLDALDHRFNALMHTDGWETSEPHWLIDQRGGLYFNIRAVVFKQGFEKPAEASADELIGRWRMLTAVYDHAAGEVRFYIDGELRVTDPAERVLPLVIDWAEIGNWRSFPGVRDARGLRGRIDEFAMFDRALSAAEVRDLYESGRHE